MLQARLTAISYPFKPMQIFQCSCQLPLLILLKHTMAAKIPCAVIAGCPEAAQADPGMQDASDAAHKVSSQHELSQAHPDESEKKSINVEGKDSDAEDQLMTDPGSHANVMVVLDP